MNNILKKLLKNEFQKLLIIKLFMTRQQKIIFQILTAV